MKTIRNKITALILTLALTFTFMPHTMNICAEDITTGVSIEYNFADNRAGYAYGSITISAGQEGEYSFYWGDKEGNKLKYNGVEYSEFGSCTATESKSEITGTYQVISPYTAIPEGAEKLLAYDNKEEKVCEYTIPESKRFHEGEVKYKFGVMSDVHYNRYSDYSSDDAVVAFDNALKFMNNQGIDFVTLTGDLSAHAEIAAYTKFNTAIKKYPKMTVYTCMGNHDDSYSYYDADTRVSNFSKYVNTGIKTDKNIKNISDTGVDFIYEKGGDIFIFLSQVQWKYNKNSFLVTDKQLNWLEKNLNTYAGRNVFIYFHSYFASENGDVTTAVGNLINPGGYTYDLTYVFGSKDEKRFRSLLNKYPNVTMFSGHSHWAYDQQKYNPNLNIGNIKKNNTGATLVHVASVTAPRTIEENATQREENNGKRSEGMVAAKYKNSTVYNAVDFKNNKYLAYATYINKDGKKGTPVPAIKTGRTKITSVGKVRKVSKKSKKYKVKIKYKKVPQAYKYQIQYSTGRKFKAKKTKTKYTKKASYTITKLKRKTKYFIRVRAYRYQFGYKVYGAWSKVKKVKTKK